MEIKFVKPKLSSTSTKEDILFAINQIIEIDKEISNLEKINFSNYTEFIKEHRDIIKKNTPIVGKTYRFINKDYEENNHYHFRDIFHKIEYFYVSYAKLQSVVRYSWHLIPKVKCIPLDINGLPFSDGSGGYLCVDSYYSNGEEIRIDQLSEEDYPEITKLFKKTTSKKTEKDLQEYNRLKRKFG
jgi:hypothetical protein